MSATTQAGYRDSDIRGTPTTDSTTTAAVQAALVAILAEVIDYPKKRPYSPDSFLPAHLVEQASAALAGAGFDVASLQTPGGAP